MTSRSLNPQSWQLAVTHLRSADPGLAPLFDEFPGEFIRSSGDPFQVLVNAIVGQQISVAAAAAIFGRLATLLGEWTPAAVNRVSDLELKAAGLSVRKVEYVRVLAAAFADGTLDPVRWETETDAQVLRELVALKGIGRWTAEMFLIFHLRRPDLLPVGDIGLLQAASRQFGWDYPLDVKLLEARAETWRPWRTVAVWYLWRALDREVVVY
ncbi:MAG: DNA-3-methyladenine glycosylase 2 family protein [Spirochaetales bacterium]